MCIRDRRISYYFTDKANKQVGPLSLDELKQQGIMRETLVWREGMPNWVQAKDIPELHECIASPKPQINAKMCIRDRTISRTFQVTFKTVTPLSHGENETER